MVYNSFGINHFLFLCIKRGLDVFYFTNKVNLCCRRSFEYHRNKDKIWPQNETKSKSFRPNSQLYITRYCWSTKFHVTVFKVPGVYNVKRRVRRSPVFYVFYCHSKNIKRFQTIYSSNSLSVSDLHTQKQDTLSARVITFFVQKFAHKNITPIKYIFTLRTWKKYFWKSVTFPVLQKCFRLFRQNVNITGERLILKYPFNNAGALGIR